MPGAEHDAGVFARSCVMRQGNEGGAGGRVGGSDRFGPKVGEPWPKAFALARLSDSELVPRRAPDLKFGSGGSLRTKARAGGQAESARIIPTVWSLGREQTAIGTPDRGVAVASQTRNP
ncbi:hypothetical protein SKAU_G00013690 [Synaphobranchus kaupii]|uniref:Uncharacterized protein n=1 Tax=Synaphobranchus kaupii TaxID=118154 RepID=A0A9Q1JBH1_SYNKA|nr:hypothetical protein SKAU_G00013690 [Synaphobranchus kaupii]